MRRRVAKILYATDPNADNRSEVLRALDWAMKLIGGHSSTEEGPAPRSEFPENKAIDAVQKFVALMKANPDAVIDDLMENVIAEILGCSDCAKACLGTPAKELHYVDFPHAYPSVAPGRMPAVDCGLFTFYENGETELQFTPTENGASVVVLVKRDRGRDRLNVFVVDFYPASMRVPGTTFEAYRKRVLDQMGVVETEIFGDSDDRYSDPGRLNAFLRRTYEQNMMADHLLTIDGIVARLTEAIDPPDSPAHARPIDGIVARLPQTAPTTQAAPAPAPAPAPATEGAVECDMRVD